jgi:hypothetical protein
MTNSDEDSIRKRFDQERLLRDKSNELSRRKIRAFGQIVVWLIAIFFLAMTAGALYWEYPFLLELIDGHQEGWVPTSLLVVLLILVAGLIAGAGAMLVFAWRSRRSNDGS